MGQKNLKEMRAGTKDVMRLLLLRAEEKKTKNNRSYMYLSLTDGETTISGNMWDTDTTTFMIPPGKVLECEIEAKEFNGSLCYTINHCMVTDEAPEPYIPSAPVSTEKMYREIYAFGEQLGPYSGTVCRILEAYRDKLLIWGAGKSIHHNIRGGLLYHIYRMLMAAVKISKVYKLDNNLLYAGVILHDIGKVGELQCNEFGAAEYTVDGKMFGHLMIGAMIVDHFAMETGLPPEEKRLLTHLIVSHHGKKEYGTITIPSIPEAAILHHIDCIDSEYYQFEEALKRLEPGSMSEKIFGLETNVYAPAHKV
ncbi:MAG TPA: HD domain-containing protein [Candidatus Blautia faecavium]|uniref:HD domain-containing protein n=1 Tax=Candidatus Blautia faecavium TaxID=2838487 RepID=A0A9D2LRP2_9FIRM|nr:HD domain-containing protein [Candidatus Blautia faecavium]